MRAVLLALSLSACVPKTKVVEIERTRLVAPVNFQALTTPISTPIECLDMRTNGDLFRCTLRFESALQQCSHNLLNLRNQYEQIQKSSASSAQ